MCLSLGDALSNVSSLHVLVYIQSAYTYSNVESWIAFEAATRKPAKRALTRISRPNFAVIHVPSQSLDDLFYDFCLSATLSARTSPTSCSTVFLRYVEEKIKYYASGNLFCGNYPTSHLKPRCTKGATLTERPEGHKDTKRRCNELTKTKTFL